jgi:hypothetical protein
MIVEIWVTKDNPPTYCLIPADILLWVREPKFNKDAGWWVKHRGSEPIVLDSRTCKEMFGKVPKRGEKVKYTITVEG